MPTTDLGHGLAALDSGLADLSARLRASTVRVFDGARGGGSGVVWSDDGIVLTNAHVVRGTSAAIDLGGAARVSAKTLGRDESADLAALRIPSNEVAALARAGKRAALVREAATLRPGELVFAMGNPLGLENALGSGVFQHCNGRWVVSDVRLAPGNSGGPLADSAGAVAGINSMIAGGRGLAVPSERVAAFLDELRAAPAVRERRFGVALQRVPVRGAHGGRDGSANDDAAHFGMIVVGLKDGSAADRSGIQLGDVLIATDRSASSDAARFVRTLGQAARIELLRAGVTLALDIAWETSSTSNVKAA